MSSGLTTASIAWASERLRGTFDRASDELNGLDAALGDGDLGVTMARAGVALAADAPNLPEDVGTAFVRCAQTVSREAAGTYGTLMATGLMAAAKVAKGRTIMPWSETSSLVGAAVAAIASRGRSELGDKTVLDTLDAVRQAIEGLDDPEAQLRAAVDYVSSTIDRFRDHPFSQGRARMFGAKGVGLDDPGMVALKRILEGLSEGGR